MPMPSSTPGFRCRSPPERGSGRPLPARTRWTRAVACCDVPAARSSCRAPALPVARCSGGPSWPSWWSARSGASPNCRKLRRSWRRPRRHSPPRSTSLRPESRRCSTREMLNGARRRSARTPFACLPTLPAKRPRRRSSSPASPNASRRPRRGWPNSTPHWVTRPGSGLNVKKRTPPPARRWPGWNQPRRLPAMRGYSRRCARPMWRPGIVPRRSGWNGPSARGPRPAKQRRALRANSPRSRPRSAA